VHHRIHRAGRHHDGQETRQHRSNSPPDHVILLVLPMRRTRFPHFDTALFGSWFLLLASCAGPNELARQAGAPGFWRGLLHGILAPVTFLISLFSDQVSMYEVHNSGHWYDLGFLVGLCAVLGGSAARRAAFKPKPPKA
jgi:hypothetical protein